MPALSIAVLLFGSVKTWRRFAWPCHPRFQHFDVSAFRRFGVLTFRRFDVLVFLDPAAIHRSNRRWLSDRERSWFGPDYESSRQ